MAGVCARVGLLRAVVAVKLLSEAHAQAVAHKLDDGPPRSPEPCTGAGYGAKLWEAGQGAGAVGQKPRLALVRHARALCNARQNPHHGDLAGTVLGHLLVGTVLSAVVHGHYCVRRRERVAGGETNAPVGCDSAFWRGGEERVDGLYVQGWHA